MVAEDRTAPMTGVGEPAVAPVAGAVMNVLYDLVGIRVFDMPFTSDRVLAELRKVQAGGAPAAGTPVATSNATPTTTPMATPVA